MGSLIASQTSTSATERIRMLAVVAVLAACGTASAQVNNRSAANADKCMTAPAADDGTQLVLSDCHSGTPGQQFFLEADGSLRVNLRNGRGNTMCVDYYPSNGGNGSAVKIWPCHGASNPKDSQHWERLASGHYRGAAGSYIDINGGNSSARNNGVPLVMWSGPGDLSQRWNPLPPNVATTPAAPAVPAVSNEPLIRNSFMDAFGRQPSVDELKFWMGIPASDSRLANAGALFNAHLGFLRTSVFEQQEAVKRALDVVFRNEQANSPALQAYLNDNNSQPVKIAIGNMLEGRDGGGYRGILAWISRPDIKDWYLKNAGIQTVLAAPAKEPLIRTAYLDAYGRQPTTDELKYWMGLPANDPRLASAAALFNAHLAFLRTAAVEQQDTVKRALDVVFRNEEASSPALRALLDDNNGMPVKTAIGNMLEGREGGGYKGILAWISKPEIKDWYLKNAGIQTAINATAAAAAAAAAANAAAKCAENASALYAFDGTETNETHRSSIWAVSQRFQGWGDCGRAGGAYIKGPNGIGSDSFDIYQWLYKQACKDVFEKKVRKVYVIGFSRGAINAVRFANQFHECGGGAKVEFVGISDPVNALMVGYDDAKTLVPGRAAHSFMMPKSKNDMNWSVKDNNFYTAAIQGFSKVEIISNREQNSDLFNGDRHWMMNVGRCISGRETEDRYIREMSALGIRFSAQLRPGDEACKM